MYFKSIFANIQAPPIEKMESFGNFFQFFKNYLFRQEPAEPALILPLSTPKHEKLKKMRNPRNSNLKIF